MGFFFGSRYSRSLLRGDQCMPLLCTRRPSAQTWALESSELGLKTKNETSCMKVMMITDETKHQVFSLRMDGLEVHTTTLIYYDFIYHKQLLSLVLRYRHSIKTYKQQVYEFLIHQGAERMSRVVFIPSTVCLTRSDEGLRTRSFSHCRMKFVGLSIQWDAEFCPVSPSNLERVPGSQFT
ncbi:hypothetical protein VTK26DRAFT_9271 [Humicola hyalothermophila]